MLLNNYLKIIEAYNKGEIASYIEEGGSNRTFSSLGVQQGEAINPLLILRAQESIALGSDNTAETGSSYQLKSKITSGYSMSRILEGVENSDGSYSVIATLTITNTSTAPITIGEVGFSAYLVYKSNSGSTCYVDRTPLETPLTIPAGEVGRILYTVTMS